MYDREVYHFLVLHFPIALFITGYFFDILCSLFNKNKFNSFVLWLMGFGLFWSFISILTGYITAFEIEHMANSKDIFSKNHSNVMLITTLIFSCIYYFRNISIKYYYLLDKYPLILTSPVSGKRSKYINRMRVVFPDPVGPIKKVNSPSSMDIFKLLTP